MNLPTPQVPDYSFQVTPKGTPIRDELHMSEEMEMRDSPKNAYLLTLQPVPVDDEESEETMEEDMSDRIAQVKAKKEEAKLLCVAMGHDDEDIDEFVEIHKTCLNKFDVVKKIIDDGTKKALRSKQKMELLTNGYKMRAAKI
ncbi:hypothetical protein Tco_0869975 [Tanacetum coccineum]